MGTNEDHARYMREYNAIEVNRDKKRQADKDRYARDGSRERERAKQHYHENKEKVLERSRQYRAEVRKIAADARRQPCMDCKGTFPPALMQFHHRDPSTKKGEVSNRSTPNAARAELAKCDVVCANCHILRHEQMKLSR
jgi:hypothetical protein